MPDKQTKHNWFSINGDIRVNKNMTSQEFMQWMDHLGIEFFGKVGYSELSDADYEDAELNETYGQRLEEVKNGQADSIEIEDAEELFKSIEEEK